MLTMLSSLEHTFFIAAIVILNIDLCISACAQTEYEINGECCPKCSPGHCVFRHCTEFTSTTCMHCVDSTYTDEPNSLSHCISCTVCDAGQGLRVKTACTLTSNTVCEPLEGFYCTNDDKGSCRYAVKHTKCTSGQYIKQKGTAVSDAECAVCADGTYSNGSLHICKKHTKCQDLGLGEITPGTDSLDAECGKKAPVKLIGTIIAVVVIVLAVAVVLVIKRSQKKRLYTADSDSVTMRHSDKQEHEGEISQGLTRKDGQLSKIDTCALNHPGNGAFPTEKD